MWVDKCVYYEGVHIYAGPSCPHERQEDETGPVIEPGWTVQSN